ncbi:MAG: invasion associated locus B family protein [Pseudomonadota bacterium]
MKHLFRVAILLLATLGAAAASAQTENRVDVKRDWSIFQVEREGSPICWIVSRPTKSVALRGGKRVQVNRGDIFLMVAVRPGDGVAQEVSFISGYPFKKGSEVEAKIGSTAMAMFTSGENAWLRGPDEDAKAVAAFQKGVDAVVEGLSARGTTTIDTFSLLGFTAALESAQSRCK